MESDPWRLLQIDKSTKDVHYKWRSEHIVQSDIGMTENVPGIDTYVEGRWEENRARLKDVSSYDIFYDLNNYVP